MPAMKNTLLTSFFLVSSALASTGDRVQVSNKDFPYICKILIMRADVARVSSICTGTLISPNRVLTARHCKPKSPDQPVVVDCNGKLSPMLDWSNYSTNEAASDDIALISLAFPIQSDLMYLAKSRRHADELLRRDECYIMGFGKKEIMEAPAPAEFNGVRLQQASFEILNLDPSFLRMFGEVTSKQFVVSGSHSIALKGDSGGPVLCRGAGGLYQVAVTSFGSRESYLDIRVWAPDFSAHPHIAPVLPWLRSKL